MNQDHEELFFARVNHTSIDGCWLWAGGRNKDGYGTFRGQGAHRWAWTLLRGEIPAGLDLDHLCNVTSCVNPWHLEPVSPQENARRRIERLPGDQRPKYEVVERELRAMLASGELAGRLPTQRALAERFHVSVPTIREAVWPLINEGVVDGRTRQVLRTPSLAVSARHPA